MKKNRREEAVVIKIEWWKFSVGSVTLSRRYFVSRLDEKRKMLDVSYFEQLITKAPSLTLFAVSLVTCSKVVAD